MTDANNAPFDATPVEDLSFREALAQLDAIVGELEAAPDDKTRDATLS